MKKAIPLLIALSASVALRAEVPTLLAEASRRAATTASGWAFTETHTHRLKDGSRSPETIVEVDPSKPYREQFRPILINGKEPDAKQRERYAQRGEKLAEQRARAAETLEAQETGDEPPKPKINVPGGKLVIDLDHATVQYETDQSVTYIIPLTTEGKVSIPLDRLRVKMTVMKSDANFTDASLEVIKPFRQMLVANVKSGAMTAVFTTPDPTLPAVLTRLRTDLSVSLFFRRHEGSSEMVCTNFHRVKPYDDRFKATAGAPTIFGF
jgi:hypothetical protein